MATDVLTRDEVAALVGAVGHGRTAPRNRALLVLMWRSGLRLDEALSLRPSDITDGTVHVRRGKGNKARTVPVDPGALATVREYSSARALYATRRGSPLFCTLDGGKLKPQYVQALCRRLAERAELDKHVHPHMLRHTYACELMREGFSAAEIMELMGHSNLAVTTVYLRKVTTPEGLRDKVHRRPSIDVDRRALARGRAIARGLGKQ